MVEITSARVLIRGNMVIQLIIVNQMIMFFLTPFDCKSHVIYWTNQNTSHPYHVCDNHLIASHT